MFGWLINAIFGGNNEEAKAAAVATTATTGRASAPNKETPAAADASGTALKKAAVTTGSGSTAGPKDKSTKKRTEAPTKGGTSSGTASPQPKKARTATSTPTAAAAPSTPAKTTPKSPKTTSKNSSVAADYHRPKSAPRVVVPKNFDLLFGRLKAFHAKHHHCRVPMQFKEDPALSRWVRTLRKKYKANELPDWQVKQLDDEVQFEWHVTRGRPKGTTVSSGAKKPTRKQANSSMEKKDETAAK